MYIFLGGGNVAGHLHPGQFFSNFMNYLLPEDQMRYKFSISLLSISSYPETSVFSVAGD